MAFITASLRELPLVAIAISSSSGSIENRTSAEALDCAKLSPASRMAANKNERMDVSRTTQGFHKTKG